VVEMTFAVVCAVYVASLPGTNASNDAGAPSVRASVAGTLPPVPCEPEAASYPGLVIESNVPPPMTRPRRFLSGDWAVGDRAAVGQAGIMRTLRPG
jgi:hypothetical protein